MGICCMAQETQTGALYQLRGVVWKGVSKGRGYVYLLMIHVEFDRKQKNSVKQLSLK